MRVQRCFKPCAFREFAGVFSASRTIGGFALALALAFPNLAEAQANASSSSSSSSSSSAPSASVPAEFSVSSTASSECPVPRAVEQAVLRLIPLEHHDLLTLHAVRVELDDLDASYRVRVFKDGTPLEKTYADPARDCDGRANFAAVFAVLTVMPPELGFAATPEPKPEPKPAPPPPPPLAVPKLEPPPPPAPPLAHVELSGLVAYAPAILDAPDLTTFGAELRVALGRGALSGTLSVAYLGRAKFELDGVAGDVTRLPASIGLRLRSEFDSWQLAGDFGAGAALQRVRGTNLLESRAYNTLEFGLRAGLQISAGNAGFQPFAGVFAWVSPGPRDISALPNGVVGNLPYLWLGGALGVSLGL